jgi:hypothetical protein
MKKKKKAPYRASILTAVWEQGNTAWYVCEIVSHLIFLKYF